MKPLRPVATLRVLVHRLHRTPKHLLPALIAEAQATLAELAAGPIASIHGVEVTPDNAPLVLLGWQQRLQALLYLSTLSNPKKVLALDSKRESELRNKGLVDASRAEVKATGVLYRNYHGKRLLRKLTIQAALVAEVISRSNPDERNTQELALRLSDYTQAFKAARDFYATTPLTGGNVAFGYDPLAGTLPPGPTWALPTPFPNPNQEHMP